MVNLTDSPEPASPRAPPWSATRFVLAAHRLAQLPADAGREVAVAGRSNAGKSSAINAITGVAALARVSKTPGRTQQLVVFELEPARRLIDLPGYGYAQVPEALRQHWRATLDRYFRERQSLHGLLLAMDIRHPLTPFDRQMLGFCAARGLPCHVLLTKADKLGRGAATTTARQVAREFAAIDPAHSVQRFSAVTRDGVDAARAVLSRWLGD
jgi:GTP-binding protein